MSPGEGALIVPSGAPSRQDTFLQIEVVQVQAEVVGAPVAARQIAGRRVVAGLIAITTGAGEVAG